MIFKRINGGLNSKVLLALMLVIMIGGIFFLLLRETDRYNEQPLTTLQDSIKVSAKNQKMGIDNLLKVYKLKSQFDQITAQDSLRDTQLLKSIDNALNHMIYEKN